MTAAVEGERQERPVRLEAIAATERQRSQEPEKPRLGCVDLTHLAGGGPVTTIGQTAPATR